MGFTDDELRQAGAFKGSVERCQWAEDPDEYTGANAVVDAAVQHLIPLAGCMWRQALQRVASDQCESPIEVAMLCGLVCVAASDASYTIRIQPKPEAQDEKENAIGVWPSMDGYGDILIQPQAEILEYRVDFLVTFDVVTTVSVVVECDGHDFHDRTPEQASRDRARDRALQARGFTVLRYTGSDIWRDVAKCAAEVIDVGARMALGRG